MLIGLGKTNSIILFSEAFIKLLVSWNIIFSTFDYVNRNLYQCEFEIHPKSFWYNLLKWMLITNYLMNR